MLVLLTGCTDTREALLNGKPGSPQDVISVFPEDGAKEVDAETRIRVKIPDGRLESVKVMRIEDAQQQTVAGRIAADGLSWNPEPGAARLALAAKYSIDAVAVDAAGQRSARRATFTTLVPEHRFIGVLQTGEPVHRGYGHDRLLLLQPPHRRPRGGAEGHPGDIRSGGGGRRPLVRQGPARLPPAEVLEAGHGGHRGHRTAGRAARHAALHLGHLPARQLLGAAVTSIFGSTNTSHGCVGLRDVRGGYDNQTPRRPGSSTTSIIGDVVIVKNSKDKQIAPDNGLNGWNMDWEEWKK
ncbi:hypothetical protein SMICM17S_12630 [Streptomyces microflavus]